MASPQAVNDSISNFNETLEHHAEVLKRSEHKKAVFIAVYRGRSKIKSVAQIAAATGLPRQAVLNAGLALANSHLVDQCTLPNPNGGGRSETAYAKTVFCTQNRSKILRLANNPGLIEKLPTKRRPKVRGLSSVRITTKELQKKKPLDVLYLMANPDETNSLRVDVEMRQVLDAVRGSKLRDHVNIHQSPAADLDSIINGLNDCAPRVLHFSGHGDSEGIAVDDAKGAGQPGKVVTFELLGRAFDAVDLAPDVVVLNACESVGARRALLQFVKALIVMNDSISDVAATAFAAKFYAAIASGQSLASAFKQGKLAVSAASIDEVDVPELVTASGVNPAKLFLA